MANIQTFSKKGNSYSIQKRVADPIAASTEFKGFSVVVGDVSYDLTIPLSQHNQIYPSTVAVYHPDTGDSVSVLWKISNKDIYIESNISLLNHLITIN
jgi:hypothetical protein